MADPPAAADCELIADGFLGQPANSISSLAFVVVGVVLLRRRPVLAWAAIAVGVGSALFHGPMPSWAKWAHDVSLAGLLVALAWERRPTRLAAAIGVLGVLFAVVPESAVAVTGALAVVTMAVLARTVKPTRWHVVALLLVSAGIVTTALSRTDGPLCAPDSVWQGHAAWHLLGAAGLWAWARADALRSGSAAATE